MLVRYAWVFGALDVHLANGAPVVNRRPTREALPYWGGGLAWLTNRTAQTLRSITR
jgi:hypothetical protein